MKKPACVTFVFFIPLFSVCFGNVEDSGPDTMSYIPPIDSVAVAASLPASVQRFHGKVLPRITVVSTEEAYQSIMAKYAAASEHAAVFGTHSGKFHTDEALGLAIRCMMEQADVPIVIVRSRAPAMLAHCDQLFDVGHVYDPARGLFDHHQKEFNGYFDKPDEEKTIMATAGLVFKEWGKRLIASLYPTMMRNEDLLTELYMAMYTDFVEAVDASDNGFSITPRGVRPRYRVTTAIQSQVGDLNQPLVQEEEGEGDGITQNQRFVHAMLVTMRPFLVMLDKKVQKIKLAAPIVSSALLKCMERRDRILILETACPWKQMLQRLEKDSDIDASEGPLLCVAPSDGSAFMLMTIPVNAVNYYLGSRLKLPEEWAGKQTEELDEIAGIDGCVFCHRGRFIAGNKTLEGTVAMAKAVMELESNSSVRDIFATVHAAESQEQEKKEKGAGSDAPRAEKRLKCRSDMPTSAGTSALPHERAAPGNSNYRQSDSE